jgi:hypothetical protein
MDLTLRPMNTSQVLDRTFQLYRRNFWLFAGIAVLPPAMIMLAQLAGLAAGAAAASAFGSLASIVTVVAVVVIFAILYLVGSALATGATVYAVSHVHLGRPVTVAESYKAVGPLVLRILGITILIALMFGGAVMVGYLLFFFPIVFGSMALRGSATGLAAGGAGLAILVTLVGLVAVVSSFVWGVWIYCRYSLAVPACVVEKLPVVLSLRRSKFLSSKSLFRIFLIYLLMVILSIVLSVVLSIPNYVGVAIAMRGGGEPPLVFQIWGFIASFLAGTLAFPTATIAVSLVYYDQRVRKEAFDLQLMMQAIGVPAPVQIYGAAAPGPQ